MGQVLDRSTLECGRKEELPYCWNSYRHWPGGSHATTRCGVTRISGSAKRSNQSLKLGARRRRASERELVAVRQLANSLEEVPGPTNYAAWEQGYRREPVAAKPGAHLVANVQATKVEKDILVQLRESVAPDLGGANYITRL